MARPYRLNPAHVVPGNRMELILAGIRQGHRLQDVTRHVIVKMRPHFIWANQITDATLTDIAHQALMQQAVEDASGRCAAERHGLMPELTKRVRDELKERRGLTLDCISWESLGQAAPDSLRTSSGYAYGHMLTHSLWTLENPFFNEMWPGNPRFYLGYNLGNEGYSWSLFSVDGSKLLVHLYPSATQHSPFRFSFNEFQMLTERGI